MLKKEIIGILKDKRTFLIILLVLIIPIIDLSVEYKQMLHMQENMKKK